MSSAHNFTLKCLHKCFFLHINPPKKFHKASSFYLKYLFMCVPFSLRRGNKEVFVEKCQVNGTGRQDDVTSSVLP